MQLPDEFDQYRALLFSIAYRMLGSVMDAEDMVQEAYLRWQQIPHQAVESPRAYLVTIITRLCIDQLRSARIQREEYLGPWLPEPLVTDDQRDPSNMLELSESLSVAFLLMLERLTPVDRAAILLHDVFGYDYREISQIIGKNESATRQIVHRARQHVQRERPRFTADQAQARRVTEQFLHTCAVGDMQGLIALLTEDVTLWSDGGANAKAARRPLIGVQNVARFLFSVLQKVPAALMVRQTRINGQEGITMYVGEQPYGSIIIDVADERIHAMYIVVNPDKLSSLQRVVPTVSGGQGN